MRPPSGGKQIGERLPRPGPRFDNRDAALVEDLHDGAEHVSLPRPILVRWEASGECSSRSENRLEGLAVQRDTLTRLRGLDHDVKTLGLIVDNGGPEARLVQVGRDAHVGLRRVEDARRVVVQHHAAFRRIPSRH